MSLNLFCLEQSPSHEQITASSELQLKTRRRLSPDPAADTSPMQLPLEVQGHKLLGKCA